MAGFLGELVTEIFGELAGLFAASKLGWFGKVASKVVTNQAFQGAVSKKVGQVFGVVDESGKTLEEELLTEDLVNFLDKVGAEVDDFISQLNKDPERGKEKVVAFRVYLASGLKKGAQQVKEFVPKPGGKPTEVIRTQLDLEWGQKFINRLLAKPTFEERIQFLEDRGVFSTMKKAPKSHPKVETIKEFAAKAGATVVADQVANYASHKKTAAMYRENATRRLEEARTKRRAR